MDVVAGAAQQQATACGGVCGIILGHARVMAGHAHAPAQQRGEGSWCWREADVGFLGGQGR